MERRHWNKIKADGPKHCVAFIPAAAGPLCIDLNYKDCLKISSGNDSEELSSLPAWALISAAEHALIVIT